MMYIDCPSCNHTTLSPYQHEEISIRCKNCQTPLSKIGTQIKTSKFLNRIDAKIPIQLGQTGIIDGKTYTVVGLANYQGVQDTEWKWDEWLLMDNQHELRWLSFSMEEGFLLLDYLESYSLNFKSIREMPTPDGKLPIIDQITAELKNFEGCLPWAMNDFDTYTYYTSVFNKTYYSLEVFQNEASLFRGISIHPQDIETGFNIPKLHTFLPWNQKIGYFIQQFFK